MSLYLKFFIDCRTNAEIKDLIIEHKPGAHPGRYFQKDHKHFLFLSSYCTVQLYGGLHHEFSVLLNRHQERKDTATSSKFHFCLQRTLNFKAQYNVKMAGQQGTTIDRKMAMT